MIANAVELKVAARQLQIMEEALDALREQLAQKNPALLEISIGAYERRIAALQTDIAHYLCEHSADVSVLLRAADSLDSPPELEHAAG